MMRMYTYSLLKKLSPEGDQRPIEDKEILAWANSKLTSMKLTSFQDKGVRTAQPVLEIIEAMKPRAINPAIVKSMSTEEDKGNSSLSYEVKTQSVIGF